MSKQFPGGLITKSPVTPSGPYETSTASGIWTLDQQAYWRKLNQWPIAGSVQPDAQFNYVTMLLHGDGTNGAQNNTFLDSSTNNFTITRNGNTTQGSFSPYGPNWSNYFNSATPDYFTFANSSNFAFGTGNFTIEFWFNASSALNDKMILDFRNGGSSNTLVVTTGGYTGSAGSLRYASGSIDITSGSTLICNGLWNHCAVVRSGTTVTLYVNGVSTATGTDSSNFSTTSGTNYFGRNSYGSGTEISGYFSNCRIVKGTAVYTSGFTPSTTPLTAVSGTSLLTFQSNRFVDNSGNSVTLTASGTPSVQRFNPFGASTAYSTSAIGGSGYFDGSGDTLTTSTSQIIPSGSFTVECWAYVTGSGNNQKFVSQGTSGSAGRFSLGIEGGNWFVQLAGDAIQTGTPVRNQWNYVAVTYNGSTITLYVNGTSIGTVSSSANAQNTTLTIGQDWNSYITTGYIADVRISNTVRTITSPTAPYSSDGSTRLLLSMTNGAIFDNAMMNDLETVGNAQISTSVVKYGTGSLYFDGTGDYLYSAKFVPFGTGNFTIECWVYPLTTAERPIFYQFPYESYGIGFGINGPSAGKLYFYSQSLISSSTAPVVTGAWQHIACVKSGGTITLYYNGTSVASGAFNQNHIVTNMYIAADPQQSGIYYNGYVDDIRITNGYARYTTNFTPPTAAFPDIGPT